MLVPQRAAVKPRVLVGDQGGLLLENEIQELLDQGVRGIVAVIGFAGAGKTTALQHLAAVFSETPHLVLMDADQAAEADFSALHSNRLVIYAAVTPRPFHHRKEFALAPWTKDDVIEYILARHREKSASIMRRIRWDSPDNRHGIPEIWLATVDQLASDESILNETEALRLYLLSLVPNAEHRRRVGELSLALIAAEASGHDFGRGHGQDDGGPFTPALLQFTRYRKVMLLFAAEQMLENLRGEKPGEFLHTRQPRDLIHLVARSLTPGSPEVERLHSFMDSSRSAQPMAASLLHEMDGAWRPARKVGVNLY